jgi:hypothetical protein
MIKLAKRLRGLNVEITLVGATKEEVLQWRDFFFNWGAIQIVSTNSRRAEMDLTGVLDDQESEVTELNGEFHFVFYARKEKVIKAFESAAVARFDWDSLTERGGKRARLLQSQILAAEALARFEAIPTREQLEKLALQ